MPTQLSLERPFGAVSGLPAALAAAARWDDTLVTGSGGRLEVVPTVSVGGGLGSFALIDALRIAGVPTAELAVVGQRTTPYDAFRDLARWSQLPDRGRLRSDSASRIDNPWGWPSYALSEARRRHRPWALAQVALEPVLARPFTPRADDVYQGIDREAGRIGWSGLHRRGTVLAVRPAAGGGFHVAYAPGARPTGPGQPGDGLVVLRCQRVHLALGHPGLCQPAQDGPGGLAAHAYTDHEAVYQQVAARGSSTVVVRGAGITASQVIERLGQDRQRLGLDTRIIQLLRSREDRDHLGGPVHQDFSAPRGAFGGQLHRRVARATGARRARVQGRVRRATTPQRPDWRRTRQRGLRQGWFSVVIADTVPEEADLVLDCTGFDDAPEGHPVLADLARWAQPERPAGQPLAVGPAFELTGTRDQGGGAVYLSGAAAGAGPAGPVDSFWGLTFAAMVITADLRAHGLAVDPDAVGSPRAWWRWLRGATP